MWFIVSIYVNKSRDTKTYSISKADTLEELLLRVYHAYADHIQIYKIVDTQ